jgi:putative nucleotidyltransferase with HDIG domain
LTDAGLTKWAYELAESLLADALPRRWAHVQGVAQRARTLAPILGADAELLEAAAVLHDIGYAPDLVKTELHPLDGARYLRDVARADDRVTRLVAHHSCAWMEAEARGLSEDLREFEHVAPELDDALCYCDMNTTPDGTPTNPIDRVNEITGRYGAGSLIGKFIRRAEPEILASTARVLERVAAARRQPM